MYLTAASRQGIQERVFRTAIRYTPAAFLAVGQFYQRFEPTVDAEVIALLHEARDHRETRRLIAP